MSWFQKLKKTFGDYCNKKKSRGLGKVKKVMNERDREETRSDWIGAHFSVVCWRWMEEHEVQRQSHPIYISMCQRALQLSIPHSSTYLHTLLSFNLNQRTCSLFILICSLYIYIYPLLFSLLNSLILLETLHIF